LEVVKLGKGIGTYDSDIGVLEKRRVVGLVWSEFISLEARIGFAGILTGIVMAGLIKI